MVSATIPNLHEILHQKYSMALRGDYIARDCITVPGTQGRRKEEIFWIIII